MGWRRSGVFLATIVVVFAAQADAQLTINATSRCAQSVADSRTLKLGSSAYPFAGVHADQGYGLGVSCRVISFYRLFAPLTPETVQERRANVPRPQDVTPRFIARLVSGDRNEAKWPTSVRWADGNACPALEPALEKLSQVVALKFTGNGPDVETLTMDGVGYGLWARGTIYPAEKVDYRFDLTMQSNVGTPLAEWIEGTLKALDPCWNHTQPEVK
jgi:hypothetical protein